AGTDRDLDGFDRQPVRLQKRFALLAGEYAGSGTDRAHTTGPESTGDPQTILGRSVVQQAPDVARIEGIAAAAAVHERNRIHSRTQTDLVVDQHGSVRTARYQAGAGAEPSEEHGLTPRG